MLPKELIDIVEGPLLKYYPADFKHHNMGTATLAEVPFFDINVFREAYTSVDLQLNENDA